jgi:biopolymer transport protein TolR
MARVRKRRKLVSEINVVPYIDVMLVLLIIFMVTAPLMNLGVDIELPQSAARPADQKDDPLVVSVDKLGALFLTVGSGKREAMEEADLLKKISTFVAQNPKVSVSIAADTTVAYGKVYQAMTLLQQAKVQRVGFISQPIQQTK